MNIHTYTTHTHKYQMNMNILNQLASQYNKDVETN